MESSPPASPWDFGYSVGPGDDPGSVVLRVSARDRVGNIGVATASVELDFEPPSINTGSVFLEMVPHPSNPLHRVQAVAHDTTVDLRFTTSEPLAGDPEILARLEHGPDAWTELTFERLDGPSPFWFRLTSLDAAPPTGDYTMTTTLVDRVGNQATAAFPLVLPVDTDPPPPLADSGDGIRYTRNPWGSDESGGNVEMWLAIDDSALLESAATLIAYESPEEPRLEIGRCSTARPGSRQGSTTRVSLNPADRVEVYLTVADPAGNQSQATRVGSGRWIATMARKIVGSTIENPHEFRTQRLFVPWLAASIDSHLAASSRSGDRLATIDGSSWSTAAAEGYWRHLSSSPTPADLAGFRYAAAFDEQRGRIVVTGDVDATPATWEWNGHRWLERVPGDPEYDGHPTFKAEDDLVYDPGRGVTWLVTRDTESHVELWQWSGLSWARRIPDTRPPARTTAVSAFDEARGELILVCGRNESSTTTWLWDGGTWRGHAAAPQPRGRTYHDMAYQTSREQVLLFGGLLLDDPLADDTWLWDGSSWTMAEPQHHPAARHGHGLAYDRLRDRVVLFGGETDAGLAADTWEWDGSDWLERAAAAAPPAHDGVRMVYHSQLQQVVLVHNDSLWHWLGDDGTWQAEQPRPLNPASQQPHPMLQSQGAAYDEQRHAMIMLGGKPPGGVFGNDTWEWDGQRWTRFVVGPPELPAGRVTMAYDRERDSIVANYPTAGNNRTSIRTGTAWVNRPGVADYDGGGAMAYDPREQRVLLFGGNFIWFDPEGGGIAARELNTIYGWSGTSWQLHAEGPEEMFGRSFAAMAADEARGVMVIRGGSNINRVLTDTWEWGSSGFESFRGGSLGRATLHSMYFDPLRQRVRLLGPRRDNSALWEWDGEDWRKVEPDLVRPYSSLLNPVAVDAAVAYDTDRNRLVLFGGDAGSGPGGLWELEQAYDGRPVQIMTVDLTSARLPQGTPVTDLQIQVVATGSGLLEGESVEGVDLWIWRAGRWEIQATALDNSSPFAWTSDDPELIRDVLVRPEVSLAITPRGRNELDTALVGVDYIQFSLGYRLED